MRTVIFGIGLVHKTYVYIYYFWYWFFFYLACQWGADAFFLNWFLFNNLLREISCCPGLFFSLSQIHIGIVVKFINSILRPFFCFQLSFNWFNTIVAFFVWFLYWLFIVCIIQQFCRVIFLILCSICWSIFEYICSIVVFNLIKSSSASA